MSGNCNRPTRCRYCVFPRHPIEREEVQQSRTVELPVITLA